MADFWEGVRFGLGVGIGLVIWAMFAAAIGYLFLHVTD